MKVCAFSDMHGNLNFTIDKCDLVLICGDIVPLSIQHSYTKSREWFKATFIPWCEGLPSEKVLFIGGNHDRWLCDNEGEVRKILNGNDKVVYLNCEAYEYDGIVVYGTPLCKIYGSWSFMKSYDEQDRMYNTQIPTLPTIDILMSHDCPFGVGDVVLEDCPWADGGHIGNESLRKFCEKISPRYNVKGHLHSTNHDCEMLGETKAYTVSLLNEKYELAYKPFYFDIEPINDN